MPAIGVYTVCASPGGIILSKKTLQVTRNDGKKTTYSRSPGYRCIVSYEMLFDCFDTTVSPHMRLSTTAFILSRVTFWVITTQDLTPAIGRQYVADPSA